MKKIRVCNSRSCTAFGANRVMEQVEKDTGVSAGTANNDYDVDYCGCLGWCSNSPNVQVDDERILFDVAPEDAMRRINSEENNEGPYLHIDLLIDDPFLKP